MILSKIKRRLFPAPKVIGITPEEIATAVRSHAEAMSADDGLKYLFDIEQRLYWLAGYLAMKRGDGLHPKHEHIKYHNFFIKNISSGESVLDIGSSVGELTYDIAKAAAPGKVIGIEIDLGKVEEAKKQHSLDNLEFVHGDATSDFPEQQFDVVTLSNVLEHIEKRPELLSKLRERYKPKRFLIRVPSYERDWRVPLKDELGVDYRLDDTHFIEYTQETFDAEMKEAGLKVISKEMRWGEIWAVLGISSGLE